MKKYEVLVADRADQDLREIFEYIVFELLSYDNAVLITENGNEILIY